MSPTSDPDLSPAPVAWGPWLTWTWVGILVACALATAIQWDDLALALDVVRHLR